MIPSLIRGGKVTSGLSSLRLAEGSCNDGDEVGADIELGGYIREFETRVRRDTDEIYSRLDDEQSERQLLAGRINMLFRDRRAPAYTRYLMEIEARLSREAWVRSMDASDLAHGKKKMAPKRTTRSTMDQETTNTTSVTNAQLQAMIDQGITAALAARDALRSKNGDDSHNSKTGVRRTERATRECTYTDFLKCQPLHFKGTEGELALLCGRMFPEESDKIERYTRGLPDMIHGSVVASKLKTMQEAVEIETELMDKKIHTFAEREIASKRKFKNTSRSTQNQQQQPNKRQNTGRVYTAASGEKKQSTANTNNANNQRGTGSGQKPTCYECGVQGHFKRECPKLKNNNNHGNQGGRDNAPAKVYAVGRAGTDPDSNVVT
nr:hypothetical protein [Tanacetum cinerariifolium]